MCPHAPFSCRLLSVIIDISINCYNDNLAKPFGWYTAWISSGFHVDSAWIPFGFRQKVTFLLTSFLHRSKITLIKGSSFHLRMRQTLRAEAEIIIVITPQGRLLLQVTRLLSLIFDAIKVFFYTHSFVAGKEYVWNMYYYSSVLFF